jgi:hypothetical protein
MASCNLPDDVGKWIESLSDPLDARIAGRLATMLVGVLFAGGRQTVTRWLRAADAIVGFQVYYYFLGSLGHKTNSVAAVLVGVAVRVLAPSGRILLAIDDTPTKRYGPHVQGAGLHHNPTPGPTDQKFLYGHVWVTLAWVVRHPSWGTIALPLLAQLYVRICNLPMIPKSFNVKFQTKLQQAAAMLKWAAFWLKYTACELWVVADGAYAKRPFLQAAKAIHMIVVSRLRKDAALFDLPEPPKPGQRRRGRPRIYGRHRIHLNLRAAHAKGWQTGEFTLYGKKVTKTYKTFLATYRPADGVIRVVIVRETDGWVAFFCTKPDATVGEIIEGFADRASIEQCFHDIKEVHGAGKQQLRNYWANIAAYNLILWMHTIIELWAWDKPAEQLANRDDSPWDNPDRRPSHADKRNSLRCTCIDDEFTRQTAKRPVTRKIKALVQYLVQMVR